MKPTRSIRVTTAFIVWTTLILLGSFCLVGAFEVWRTDREFRRWVSHLELTNNLSHKEYIRDQTLDALQIINKQRESLQNQYRQELINKVTFTVDTLDLMEGSVKASIKNSPQQLVQLLNDTVEHFSDLGNLFIMDLSGQVIFYENHPALENTNIYNLKGADQTFYVREIIELARGVRAGSYHYKREAGSDAKNPSSEDMQVYVKLYENFQWIVGAEVSDGEIRHRIQDQVLESLERISYLKRGYIFGCDYNGTGLIGPSKGKNNIDVTDQNGVKVVQEMIRLAQNGGGFLKYIMPPVGDMPNNEKISFVMPVKGWSWYIGAGMYIEDINGLIASQKVELSKELWSEIKYLIGVYASTLIFFVLLTLLLARSIRGQLGRFMEFFKQGTLPSGPNEINIDSLRIHELRVLAKAANEMAIERRQLENEIEVQNLHTLTLAKQATMANEAKSNFLARISHELRTPLNAIIGFTGLLEQENLTRQQVDYLNQINQAGHDLNQMVNDILLYSGLPGNDKTDSIQEMSLIDLLETVYKKNQSAAQAKNLEFDIHIPEPLPLIIHSDFNSLQQCLNQLISNAVKFTAQGSVCLTVGTTHRNDRQYIRFEIRDTGVGIEPQNINSIFNPFFQGEESLSRRYEGIGLGLSVVKKIVDKLSGSISVQSEPGKGTQFNMIIPNCDPQKGAGLSTFDQRQLAETLAAHSSTVNPKVVLAPPQSLPDTAPPIGHVKELDDKDMLVSSLADDPELAIVVTMFVQQDLPVFMSRIRSALMENNYEQLLQTFHDLKGTSGNAGFGYLSERARTIETGLLNEGSIQYQDEIEKLLELCARVTV